jgi:peptidoglycan/LPS O-acetylase OafA/YrhL
LGDLSYPLYLVHWSVSGIAAAMIGSLQPNSIGTVAAYPILMVMIAIAVSVLINRYLVLPIETWRQARVHTPSTVAMMLSPKLGAEGVG